MSECSLAGLVRARRVRIQRASSFLGGLGGLSLGSSSLLGLSLSGSLLFLHELGDELLVLGGGSLGVLGALDLGSLDDSLSADALLRHESLDLGGLVVGLVASLDLSVDHISSHIVVLLEVEVGADVVGSLLGESVGLGVVGEAGDVLLALLDHGEGNDSEVGSADASTD